MNTELSLKQLEMLCPECRHGMQFVLQLKPGKPYWKCYPCRKLFCWEFDHWREVQERTKPFRDLVRRRANH